MRHYLPVWGNAAAIAATLVVGIALGHFGSPGSDADVSAEKGTLIARGPLAQALDTQLASNQSPQAAVRIGVSFHDQSDRLCRTFQNGEMGGLACRDAGQWMLANTASGKAQAGETTYRQAGTIDPFIMQAAQAAMKGEPLSADAERLALQDRADVDVKP